MKKRLLVGSAGLVHPTGGGRRRLGGIIDGVDGIERTTVCRVEALKRLTGGRYDGAVLYFHRKHISEAALDALDRFVAGGGGVLAIHGASASFKKVPRYYDILGGRFVGHGRIEPYTVQRTAAARPFFTVTQPFAVTDELYIHRYENDVTIHYATETAAGPEPVVWTRAHGKGRVCYISLGHVPAVLANRAVRRIISDALAYIAGLDTGVRR